MRENRRILVLTNLLITLLLLFGVELFLRRRLPYVAKVKDAFLTGVFSPKGTPLYQWSDRAKRLAPSTEALIRNHYVSRGNILIQSNSLGLRDDEIAPVKSAGEHRVLVIGDSITLGDYVPSDEVWLKKAETILNKVDKATSFKFINAGMGGTGLHDYMRLLRELLGEIKPDTVIIGFYLNDARPEWGFAKEVARPGWLRRHFLLADRIYTGLKMMLWQRDAAETQFSWVSFQHSLNWKESREDFLSLVDLARYDWGSAWSDVDWDGSRKQLQELRDLSIQHGFKVLVVGFPVIYQVVADFVEDLPQRRLEEITINLNFGFLDLLPLLRRHRSEVLFYDHCHPTPLGNQLVGEEVARFVERYWSD